MKTRTPVYASQDPCSGRYIVSENPKKVDQRGLIKNLEGMNPLQPFYPHTQWPCGDVMSPVYHDMRKISKGGVKMTDRILYGCINKNGTIYSGSGGFNVCCDTGGNYTILFNTPFRQTPAIVLTQNFPDWNDWGPGGSPQDTCVLISANANKCKVLTGNDKHGHENRNFCFIAIGPE
ncbi:MAG: hypothetical protein HXS54_00280 [Theionarchaea archaeon]|nr:hypothetical protein [Theionarchaea archaeon]